jgi:uncharacterized Zn finger protein
VARARYDRFYGDDGFDGWPRYVSKAERRRQATIVATRLAKRGRPASPIAIAGRTIATTFWGAAWCRNLERYSDFANRLPRGRSYVRSGAVIDLQIDPGRVAALVSGSDVYEVTVAITPLSAARWKTMCRQVAGGIDSLVELLQGRFSRAVMEQLCRPGKGLFPTPREIGFTCTCPDWASMCKHVAAVLYGVGARLDHTPELLFRLRQVNEQELVTGAGTELTVARPTVSNVLPAEDLAEVFGMDFGTAPPAASSPRSKAKPASKPGRPRAQSAPPAKARGISAEARLAVSARMKRYWAERRRRGT